MNLKNIQNNKKNYNIAIFPGTFSEFHDGHISLIKKSMNLFEKIYIVVSNNPNKKYSCIDKRIENIKKNIFYKKYGNSRIFIIKNEGMTIDILNMLNCYYIIRGVRNKDDFEYELKLYDSYKKMFDNFEIVYFFSDIKMRKISSSYIKEKNNEN